MTEERLAPERDGILSGTPQSRPGAGNENVRLMLDAAEGAAQRIVEDADADAQRQLQQSREAADRLIRERAELISELTDDLVRRAAAAGPQSDAVVKELDEAVQRLSAELAGPAEYSDPGSSDEGKPPVSAELVRLLSTEMTFAGSSPEEIERRLRDEFGIEDSSAILE